MDYKKSYALYNICLYAGLILCVVSLMIHVTLPGIAGAVAIILGIFQAGLFYRCPYCHTALHLRGKKPKYCPECGQELDL